jgi:hypothetical protein
MKLDFTLFEVSQMHTSLHPTEILWPLTKALIRCIMDCKKKDCPNYYSQCVLNVSFLVYSVAHNIHHKQCSNKVVQVLP